jgi:hypothetical protein
MKVIALSLVFIGIVGTLCFGQSGVAITGKVSGPNGVGLPGTIVRLAVAGLETETDAGGNYALGSGKVDVQHLLKAKTGAYSKPILLSGKVLFTVGNDNARVRISVHDLCGRFVAEMLNSRLSSGNYSVALDGRNYTSQPYVLNVNINGASHAMKFSPVGSRSIVGVSMDRAARVSSLEKAAAVNDTIKVTKPGYSIGKQAADVSAGTYNFTLTKTSTWNGDTVAFWGNTNTYPTAGVKYVILNRTNGAFPDSKIFWTFQQFGTPTSIATQSTVQALGGNGRLYIYIAPNDSVDAAKHGKYFDFIEFAGNGTTTWNGNTTRVDGWRLPITFRIHTSTGIDVTLGDAYEMFYQPRQTIFDEYVNENPKEFIGLATQNFANIYAPHMSPVNYFNTNGPYANYFVAYENEVAAAQASVGALAPVSTWNIFACAGGGMGSSPIYSAAVNRHCGTLPQSAWNNDTNYYKAAPCNYFSKWCHRRSLRNMSYGFPYDDVGGHAAFTGQSNVQWIAIAIGW